MRRTAVAVLLSLGMSAGANAANDPAPLVITFSEQVITISSATPGGKVVLFGVAREMSDSRPRSPRTVRRAEILSDDDGDGIVRYDLQRAIPRMAMWAAVDLAGGGHVAAPTPGFAPAQIAITPDLVKNDNSGQLKKLEWPFAEMDLLLVRPGTGGAWRLYASKYSAIDENRASNNPLRVDIANMEPVGDSPEAPGHFKNGDVIALFDRRWMQYGIIRVGK